MKKLFSSILVMLLWFIPLSADELSKEFLNNHLSKIELYQKYPKNSFFSGSVNINGNKLFYASREDTKSGQFYIFYVDDNNKTVVLVKEETNFFIKSWDQTISFAPRKVELKDLNSDAQNEIILFGRSWGTNEDQDFEKVYFFSKTGKLKIKDISDYRRVRTLYYPPSYWHEVIPESFKNNQNYIKIKKMLEENGLHWDVVRKREYISGMLVKEEFKIILVEYWLGAERKAFFTKTEVKSLVNELFLNIYGKKFKCDFDIKFECIINSLS